jgi:hypothetical protein
MNTPEKKVNDDLEDDLIGEIIPEINPEKLFDENSMTKELPSRFSIYSLLYRILMWDSNLLS